MGGGRVDVKITIIPVNNDNQIIIIIIIIILTLDHNKYNDDTNHRQEPFVVASHPFSISRLGLLPSKIRNARAQFLPATEIPYECLGRV